MFVRRRRNSEADHGVRDEPLTTEHENSWGTVIFERVHKGHREGSALDDLRRVWAGNLPFEMLLPIRHLGAQLIEVEIWEGGVRVLEIAQGTVQNRAGPDMVASGVVMKGDRQLNHPLDVQAEMQKRWAVARYGAPDVFENFMGLEEMGLVEKIDAFLDVLAVG